MSEIEFIQWLKHHAPHSAEFSQRDFQQQQNATDGSQPRQDSTRYADGIGDDAALVCVAADEILVCTDTIVEGVHFYVDRQPPELIGRKALAVNISDIAAMGGIPKQCVVGVCLPNQSAADKLQVDYHRLFQGLFDLAREHSIAVVGGDTTSWPHGLVITVTLIGEPGRRVWSRDQAKVGDRLLATGDFGGSLAGQHLSFTPRRAEAAYLNAHFDLSCAIDVSDGLAIDLHRLCRASQCGAKLFANKIPVSEAAKEMCPADQEGALRRALFDGEDFELLLTAPPAVADAILRDESGAKMVSDIGEIVVGDDVLLEDAEGKVQPLEDRGYVHPLPDTKIP